MFENIDALFFDMDGTIIDSMWMWHDIDVEFLANHGIAFPERLQQDIDGKNFYETAVYFKERFQLEESTQELMDCWNQMAMDKYRHEVPLKPGFLEFLQKAKSCGLKLGIATANSRELATAGLEAHGIKDFFDVIITGTDGLKGKPAPDIYLACAKAVSILPEHCLVFEDVISGLTSAITAGMKTCAVYDKASANLDEDKHRMADYYIMDFRELEL